MCAPAAVSGIAADARGSQLLRRFFSASNTGLRYIAAGACSPSATPRFVVLFREPTLIASDEWENVKPRYFRRGWEGWRARQESNL